MPCKECFLGNDEEKAVVDCLFNLVKDKDIAVAEQVLNHIEMAVIRRFEKNPPGLSSSAAKCSTENQKAE